MSKQYVCHISGQGEKWEVLSEEQRHWRTQDQDIVMWLPKSEYRLCEPPEVWQDMTEECEALGGETFFVLQHSGSQITTGGGYRLRKVLVQVEGRADTCWAFIVEKKVSG